MAEKRPAETSTEEPASKKQAHPPGMYEEMKAKIAELETEKEMLKKSNEDGQKLSKDMNERMMFRISTAEAAKEKSDSKLRMIKHLSKNSYTHKNGLFYNKTIKKIVNVGCKEIDVSKLIMNAIHEGKDVAEVEVKLKHILYDKYIIEYKNKELFYDINELPQK